MKKENKNVEETENKSLDELIVSKKNFFIYPIVAVVIIIIAIFVYNKNYIKPLNEEAYGELYWAEEMFRKDSFNIALNGGKGLGFLDIIDEYGSTDAANLANFYAGVCNLKLKKYKEAISFLSKYDSDNINTQKITLSLIGDAYYDMNEIEKASNYYKDAIENIKNEIIAPNIYIKLYFALEELKKYDEAISLIKTLKIKFPNSQQARDADIYLGRLYALKK